MNTNSFPNKILDKIIAKLPTCSPTFIIIYATIFVLLGSIPLVYLTTKIFNVEYTYFFLFISIFLPLILTPLVISLLIRLTKHLSYYKDYLEDEINKNKAKDIILFEQARFVVMGEMMANISHQWKQPLNTIGLAVVSAKTSGLKEDTVDRSFDIIEDNINYLADTINDFMSFFDKRTSSELKNIETIVHEVKSISHATVLSKNINLNIDIQTIDKNIELASSISQVLLNLINNARDAFCSTTKNKEITIKFVTHETNIEIICLDNAGGIDNSIIDKIFDPYFTTKMKSQGIGIGLYMSKQIIQKIFHADIRVISADGNSCFYIRIPYSDRCVRNLI